MPSAGEPDVAAASDRNASTMPPRPRPDVVAVHDPDEDAVRVGVEAVEELVALVVEVRADREPPVGLDGAPEAARRSPISER